MSEIVTKILDDMTQRYGPVPEQFVFGDGIDWSSPLADTILYVELPFWLMLPAGPVEVEWSGVPFTVHVCPKWMEVFVDEITDSRVTLIRQSPWQPDYEPPPDVAAAIEGKDVTFMRRPCKTVLRLAAKAHSGAFRHLGEEHPPRAHGEQAAYWASLCEAHIPVINELIQRYRLVTYDYFAYEVSPWDVPVWHLKHADEGFRAVLLPYKEWDAKPVTVEDGDAPGDPPKVQQFQWATADDLTMASADATPGEFDLLDARNLMERGNYTGAVRRTVTAIEAVLAWALQRELEPKHTPEEAAAKLARTDNDFPGRLRQWRKLAKPKIGQVEFDEFDKTRGIRHEIVHRARRLIHDERGRAQRAVDTGRWLYNKIEGKPDRARLRDYGVLKAAGRHAMTIRFPSDVGPDGIKLRPISIQVPPFPPAAATISAAGSPTDGT